jgi:hypothetical protein
MGAKLGGWGNNRVSIAISINPKTAFISILCICIPCLM